MSRNFLILPLAIAAFVANAQAAHAQVARTFVSGHGVDTGTTCPLATPCRTFAYAINQTNPGGEITVLDPAGYGPVNITKAIGIINDGVGEAGVTLTSGDAITINAGASDNVVLRGLTLVGGGAGANGVTFNTGRSLLIEKSSIRGFTNFGVNFLSSTAISTLEITDTAAVANGSGGVLIEPTAANVNQVSATISGSDMSLNTGSGFALTGAGGTSGVARATVTDSVLSGNGGNGVTVISPNQHPFAHLMLRSSKVVNNIADGIQILNTNDASGGAVVRITRTTITGNNMGIANSNGQVLSYQDNNIDDDISGGDAAPTTVSYK